jgi:hypothetical protein
MRFFQRSIKHAPRRTDKRAALAVFIITGLLADKDNACGFGTFAEYGLRRVFVKIAAFAGPGGCAEIIQGPLRWEKIGG